MSAGLGTHIDSPTHCFKDTSTVKDIASEMIYDTIMFDCTEFAKNNFHITLETIVNQIETQNLYLNNKFIIIKTGWGTKWNTEGYFNNYTFPYIDATIAMYFANAGIAGLGIDTLSPDAINNSGYFPVHEILLSKSIFIIENIAHLEKINTTEFRSIIAPLKIDSTESPIRLAAILD
jgi:kynurenine formamidase